MIAGHYATCSMLGYSLEDNVNGVAENTTDEFEAGKSIEEGKDEIEFVDEDGNPIYQGVDYSKIVVHLVAAIQELSAEVEALKAKVGA